MGNTLENFRPNLRRWSPRRYDGDDQRSSPRSDEGCWFGPCSEVHHGGTVRAVNGALDLDLAESANRECDYRKVCVLCGVLLEALLQGLLAEVRTQGEAVNDGAASPGRRPQAVGGETLGSLLATFENHRLFEKLPDVPGRSSRRGNARFVNWEILKVVSAARNDAAHARAFPPDREKAAECLDATRALYRWFSRVPCVDTRGDFAAATLVAGLDNCKEPMRTALSRATGTGMIRVKVLGLTLGQAWRLWTGDLLGGLPETVRCVADFALIDPEWDYIDVIDPRWRVQAEGIVRTIALEAPEFVDEHPNVEVRVWKYRGHPSIHGAMVNDDFLAASLLPPRRVRPGRATQPGGGPLEAARGQYFLLRAGAGPLSDCLHRHFQDAFAFVSSGKPWRRYGVTPGEGADPSK